MATGGSLWLGPAIGIMHASGDDVVLSGTAWSEARMKRAGTALVVSGVLVLAFYLATDATVMPGWMERVGWGRNQVDAVG